MGVRSLLWQNYTLVPAPLHGVYPSQPDSNAMTQISTLNQLAEQITIWAQEAGFQQVGIADTALESEAGRLHEWLARGYHGDMGWLQDNLDKRLNPGQLVEGSCRVISFRMDYMPADTQPITILKSADKAYVSRYALGRDYHKLIRKRLANIAKRIATAAEPLLANGSIQQRPFVDSAPVLERPLAAKAGLGWIGKHTLLLNEQAGSWFFLGEIVTNIPLPTTNQLIEDQCGSCEACLKVCPTDRLSPALRIGRPALHFLPHYRTQRCNTGEVS